MQVSYRETAKNIPPINLANTRQPKKLFFIVVFHLNKGGLQELDTQANESWGRANKKHGTKFLGIKKGWSILELYNNFQMEHIAPRIEDDAIKIEIPSQAGGYSNES